MKIIGEKTIERFIENTLLAVTLIDSPAKGARVWKDSSER